MPIFNVSTRIPTINKTLPPIRIVLEKMQAGGFMGPLALIAVPVIGLAGGVAGAFDGDAFVKWSVDITCIGCENDVLEETKRSSFGVRRN